MKKVSWIRSLTVYGHPIQDAVYSVRTENTVGEVPTVTLVLAADTVKINGKRADFMEESDGRD